MTALVTALTAEPVQRSEARRSPWLLYATPAAVFDYAARTGDARRPLQWLLAVQPLLPVAVGVGSVGTVRHLLLSDPALAERAAAAPFVAAFGGAVVLLTQVMMLLMHFVVFSVVGRVVLGGEQHRRLGTVWAYAMFPLVLRQLSYLLVVVVAGREWYAAHASLVGVLDPFVLAAAVFFYVGARRVLGAGVRQALVLSGSATVVGALGAALSLGAGA